MALTQKSISNCFATKAILLPFSNALFRCYDGKELAPTWEQVEEWAQWLKIK